jgi:nucleoside-diphosphate-sugar epimerase
MKIVVIGGTGLIGWKLVAGLTERGHEAIAAAAPRCHDGEEVFTWSLGSSFH